MDGVSSSWNRVRRSTRQAWVRTGSSPSPPAATALRSSGMLARAHRIDGWSTAPTRSTTWCSVLTVDS